MVEAVLPAENVARNRRAATYALAHSSHLKAVHLEIADGARIAGYYHSHPHGLAEPSERDEAQAVEDTT